MTEDDWFTGADFAQCVELIRKRASERKKWLYVSAYGRAFWDHLAGLRDARPRWFPLMNLGVPRAVAAAEAFADGRIGPRELYATLGPFAALSVFAVNVASADLALNVVRMSDQVVRDHTLGFPVHHTAWALMHELLGDTFRPRRPDPAWLEWNGGTVETLARVAYDEKRFDLLPVLADALEEAGCGDGELLLHCRGPGPHVRGCWAVDLILGKT